MSILRTVFWVIVAVVLALFTVSNWDAPHADSPGRIAIALWNTNVVEVRLPILIIAAFLLGLVPMWLWSRATKWQLQRKLSSTERALASTVVNQHHDAPPPPAPLASPSSITETP